MFRSSTSVILLLTVSFASSAPLFKDLPNQQDIFQFSNSNKASPSSDASIFRPFREVPERLIDTSGEIENNSQERVSAYHSEDDIFYKFASFPLLNSEKSSKSFNGF